MRATMTKHPPGPWRVEEGTDLVWGACDENDHTTCGMGYPISRGVAPQSVWQGGKPEVFERSANARLIACAPEMLDMLKLIVDYADDGVLDFFYSEIGKVKEIITKATTL